MANNDKEKDGTAEEVKWTYKEWYERNKESLAERRKNRYHEDKKYRQKVLQQNRDYRAKKAKERKAKPKPKVRIPKHRKPVEMEIQVNGHRVNTQLVHVGAFARAIGRSVPTIHQWERLGLLPRTPYMLQSKSKQERLYTEDMIKVVREVLGVRGATVSSSDPTFRQEIIDGWMAVGTAVKDEK